MIAQESGIALDDSGGVLRLLGPDGEVRDRVAFAPLAPDASYSLDENGIWHYDWPASPGRPNLPVGPK
jgi:hypothetical protein